MLKGAIARRYAEAIFDIARRQNTVDRTLDDEPDVARDRVRDLVNGVILPPFRFDHANPF